MRLNILEMLKARTVNAPSLSRTMVFLSFLTCTGVIIWYAYNLQLDWDMFGLYLVTMVGAYQGASYQSRKFEEKKIEAIAPEVVSQPGPDRSDSAWPAGNQPDIPKNPDEMP